MQAFSRIVVVLNKSWRTLCCTARSCSTGRMRPDARAVACSRQTYRRGVFPSRSDPVGPGTCSLSSSASILSTGIPLPSAAKWPGHVKSEAVLVSRGRFFWAGSGDGLRLRSARVIFAYVMDDLMGAEPRIAGSAVAEAVSFRVSESFVAMRSPAEEAGRRAVLGLSRLIDTARRARRSFLSCAPSDAVLEQSSLSSSFGCSGRDSMFGLRTMASTAQASGRSGRNTHSSYRCRSGWSLVLSLLCCGPARWYRPVLGRPPWTACRRLKSASGFRDKRCRGSPRRNRGEIGPFPKVESMVASAPKEKCIARL